MEEPDFVFVCYGWNKRPESAGPAAANVADLDTVIDTPPPTVEPMTPEAKASADDAAIKSRARQLLIDAARCAHHKGITRYNVSRLLDFVRLNKRRPIIAGLLSDGQLDAKLVPNGDYRSTIVYFRPIRERVFAAIEAAGEGGCPERSRAMEIAHSEWINGADELLTAGRIRAEHTSELHGDGTRYFVADLASQTANRRP